MLKIIQKSAQVVVLGITLAVALSFWAPVTMAQDRPLASEVDVTREELGDSSGAKVDTTRFKADSLRLAAVYDSLALKTTLTAAQGAAGDSSAAALAAAKAAAGDSARTAAGDSVAQIDSTLTANLEDSLLFGLDLWGSSETVARNLGSSGDGVLTGFSHDATDGYVRDGSRRALLFDGDGDRGLAAVSLTPATDDWWFGGAIDNTDSTGIRMIMRVLKSGNGAGDRGIRFQIQNAIGGYHLIFKDTLDSPTFAVIPVSNHYQWNHFLVASNSGTFIAYVNGDSVFSGAVPATMGTLDSLVVGNGNTGTQSQSFIGDIGNVFVGRGRALSANEVSALYHQFRQEYQPGHPVSVDEDRDVTLHANLTVDDTVDLGDLEIGGARGTDGQVPTRQAGGSLAWETPAGGGGGGGATPLDTLFYDYILGYTSTDSLRAGGYSKFIKLGGAQADTSDADTLIWCIDQLKANGGEIYVCGTPADTMWWYKGGTAYDSLPTSGGIDGTVTITGDGMDKTIFAGHVGSSQVFAFTSDRHAGVGGAALRFRNLQLRGCQDDWTPTFYTYAGRVEAENCRIIYTWFYHNISVAGGSAPGDSTLLVKNCVFGTPDLVTAGEVMGYNDAHVIVMNCTGYFSTIESRMSSAGTYTISGNVFRKVKSIQAGVGGGWWFINGNTMKFINTTYEAINVAGNHAKIVGNVFIGPTDDSVPYAVTLTYNNDALSSVGNNDFWHCGLYATTSRGNHFYDAATGWKAGANSSYCTSSTFQGCTTAIDINAKTGVVAHGNIYRSCTTDVSGTPGVNTDNNSL